MPKLPNVTHLMMSSTDPLLIFPRTLFGPGLLPLSLAPWAEATKIWAQRVWAQGLSGGGRVCVGVCGCGLGLCDCLFPNEHVLM